MEGAVWVALAFQVRIAGGCSFMWMLSRVCDVSRILWDYQLEACDARSS
jgi:hypothetical protein